jgi:hypothetical protein
MRWPPAYRRGSTALHFERDFGVVIMPAQPAARPGHEARRRKIGKVAAAAVSAGAWCVLALYPFIAVGLSYLLGVL